MNNHLAHVGEAQGLLNVLLLHLLAEAQPGLQAETAGELTGVRGWRNWKV